MSFHVFTGCRIFGDIAVNSSSEIADATKPDRECLASALLSGQHLQPLHDHRFPGEGLQSQSWDPVALSHSLQKAPTSQCRHGWTCDSDPAQRPQAGKIHLRCLSVLSVSSHLMTFFRSLYFLWSLFKCLLISPIAEGFFMGWTSKFGRCKLGMSSFTLSVHLVKN